MRHETEQEEYLYALDSKQQADTFVSTLINDEVAVRLYSVRCYESQMDALPNQDYARVVWADGVSSLSFCVCDGVGSSYLGNFAARYLAIRLVDWLRELPGIPRMPQMLAKPLRAQLNQWAYEGQAELQNLPLPARLPSLEREIIEEQRDTYGSETVFFGGRIDYKALTSRPIEKQTLRALFCWMGNVTAHVCCAPGAYQELGDPGNDRNRWSTIQGYQGTLTLRTVRLNRAEPLIIHTDGLDALGLSLAQLDHDELLDQMRHLLSQPANDDMTLLDLRWIVSREEDAAL